MSCTLVVRINKAKELLIGHNTHNIYSLMLRIFKIYHFIEHENNNSLKIEFSSRPGDLSSKDDFYSITHYNLE
jgi:hypothetical protein